MVDRLIAIESIWTANGEGPDAPCGGTTGDITADGHLYADGNVTAWDGSLQARVQGADPSGGLLLPGAGDIWAADDLIALDKVTAGQILIGDGSIANLEPGALFDISSEDDLSFTRDSDGDGTANWFRFFDGTAGGPQEIARIEQNGDMRIGGNLKSKGFDLAEEYPTRDTQLRPGRIVAVDPGAPEHVRAAVSGRDSLVVGIVSTDPGLVLSDGLGGARPDLLEASDLAFRQGDMARGRMLREAWRTFEDSRVDVVQVALAGRVPLDVDLSGGTIRAGDRIGLGATPGVGARHTGYGPVIGLALEDLAPGAASVVVFVHMESGSGGIARDVTPVRGAGHVRAGFQSITVEHEELTADSTPVVTLYGDAGGRHWVEERGHGYFVLRFEHPLQRSLEFGYMASR